MSTIDRIGLPHEFGVTLLVLSLILSLVPYASGADFGLFKVPKFPKPTSQRLRIIGPIALGLSILAFVPVWPSAGQDAKAEQRTSDWKTAWFQINQPLPSYGDSTGVRATNRARLLLLLDPLTSMNLDGIERLAAELAKLVRSAPSRSDPFYDLQLTPEIDSQLAALRQQIRQKAVAAGVDVR
jgi:hypothetical protein